jgi:hypothetical protein
MALSVEDGTIIAGAESYVSAADATTYHAARGNAAWTGTDAIKEAALLKAAAYLDGHYCNRFKGSKYQPLEQAMQWPRVGVFIDGHLLDAYTIPQRLKDAQCELALIALSADLAPSVSAGIKREKVDVLETEYFAGAPVGTTVYTAVNNLLSDLLKPLNTCEAVRG